MADEKIKGYRVCLLPKDKALTFIDHLNSLGISAFVSEETTDHESVYVEKYSDVGRAKRELLSWAENPFSGSFNQASWAKGTKKSLGSMRRGTSFGWLTWNPCSLTSIVEVICVVFFIGQFINEGFMLELFSLNHSSELMIPWDLYRLLTPTFLHFGIMHILFNLVMWEAMARPVEKYVGKTKLFSVFISVALISNVMQFGFMPQNGIFGGLSGVVYGTMAYFGMISRRADCPQGFFFPKGLITVSIIFIAFGFFTSGTANVCHLAGLILGLLWGFVDQRRKHLF